MNAERSFLFICGCPRSGTTAMWNLLVASPEIVLGVERYGVRFGSPIRSLSPDLFTYDRFFTVSDGDTFYQDLDTFHPYYQTARQHWQRARLVGDKVPRLYMKFGALARNFPGARVIFMVRNIFDVAASYKKRAEDATDTTWDRARGVSAAIDDWTASMAAYQGARGSLDILAVDFEALFMEGQGFDALCRFLDVEDTRPLVPQFKGLLARSQMLERARQRDLSAVEAREICRRAPFDAYRAVVEEAARGVGSMARTARR